MKVLFDIGGTKTRVATTRDLKTFSEPVVFNTPKTFDEFLEVFNRTAHEVTGGEPLEQAAGGIAGPFEVAGEVLYKAPRLPEWGERIPIRQKLEEVLGAPVLIYNDSVVVGMGEAHFGAGRGHNIVVYITVSTGVGGARIVGGKIDQRVYGFEPGWQVIDAGNALCEGCSEHGYLLDYISGAAVEARTGKKPYEITDEAFWDTLATWLAYGLNNTIVHWSPDVVVLGGSMMKKIGIHVPNVKQHLEEVMHIYPTIPEIKHSELEDFGGLYGAMACLKEASLERAPKKSWFGGFLRQKGS